MFMLEHIAVSEFETHVKNRTSCRVSALIEFIPCLRGGVTEKCTPEEGAHYT
jgi:hypothetical protein